MPQKRVYKRIDDFIDIEFIPSALDTMTITRTKTRDISAGGVKVYLNYSLQIGDKMQLSITLPYSKKIVKAEADVVRSDLIGVVGDSGEGMLFETRFKFIRISAELKNAITHYVFECRRKARDAQARREG